MVNFTMRRIKLGIQLPNGDFTELNSDLIIDHEIQETYGEITLSNAVKLIEMSKIGLIVNSIDAEKFIPLKELI